MAKVLISIDEALLRRVDRRASASGLTRSAYIAQLARRDVAAAQRSGGAPVRAALKRLEQLMLGLPREDSTSAVRAERDNR